MDMNVKPLADRVLVKPAEAEETTKSGIIIPDTAKEKPAEGKVVAVGEGNRDDHGKRIPLDVKKGDHILFAKWGGTEVKVDGRELIILKETDILAIVKKGK